MGGVPCIRGLRIPVATVVGMIASGMTPGEVVDELPPLGLDDVAAALSRWCSCQRLQPSPTLKCYTLGGQNAQGASISTTTNRRAALTLFATCVLAVTACASSTSTTAPRTAAFTVATGPEAIATPTAGVGTLQDSTPSTYPFVPPVSYAPTAAATGSQVGASPAEVTARLARAFPHVVSATVGEAPSAKAMSKVWLNVVTRVDSGDPHPVEPVWEAEALEGAIAEELATTGILAEAVSGVSVTFQGGDGSLPNPYVGVAGRVAARQVFAGPTDPDAIRQQVMASVIQFGLADSKVTVDVYDAHGPAVAVHITVGAAAELRGDLRGLQAEIDGTNKRWPAVYLEIVLPNGQFIAKLSQAFRTGNGGVWIDPAYEDTIGGPAHA